MRSTPVTPSRRTLLHAAGVSVGAATVAILAGCTISDDPEATPQSQPSTATTTSDAGTDAGTDADVALLTAAIADEEATLDFCQELVHAHPGLRDVVQPIRSRQREHVRRLRGALVDAAASRERQPPHVPRHRRQALRSLARLLASAEGSRYADCQSASSGLLAQLLASVAASHAVAVEVVRDTK